MSPSDLSPSSPHRSLPDERVEAEEGQFDNVEKDETHELLKLHPSEQPLPLSPPSSPSLSPSLSRVDQMVQCILLVKHQTSKASAGSESPDTATTAVSSPEAPQCPPAQGSDDVSLMDSPNALSSSSRDNRKLMEPSPLKYTPLPSCAGQGTLIQQLFAPRGAFVAPPMVCPPPMPKESTMACVAPGPTPLPSLLL